MYAVKGTGLMHLQKKKKRHSEDPDETPQNAASGSVLSAMLSTFLVTEDNIKSYMNHGLFHFLNWCKTLKEGNAIIYNP